MTAYLAYGSLGMTEQTEKAAGDADPGPQTLTSEWSLLFSQIIFSM